MTIPGHGSPGAPAPAPAPGTPPVAPTPAPGTPPAAPTPTTAGHPPAAHTSRLSRIINPRSGALLVVMGMIGGLFGYLTWDHKRVAWTIGWALIFMAMTILVLWFLDWLEEGAAPAASTSAPGTPPAAPIPAPTPAAPVTPCTCATPPVPVAGSPVGNLLFNGQTWHWDGTTWWCMFP